MGAVAVRNAEAARHEHLSVIVAAAAVVEPALAAFVKMELAMAVLF